MSKCIFFRKFIDFLNIVSDQVTLADALAGVEPEEHFSCDKGVQPGLLDGDVLPGTLAGSADELADSATDGWDVPGSWGCQLNLGILDESLEFWTGLDDQSCKENKNYVTTNKWG